MNRIIVVGASLAAVHAIAALREHGYGGEVVLVGAESGLPYDRPPLSKEALRGDASPSLLRESSWYGSTGVTMELGTAAAGLETGSRVVALDDGRRLDYDGLLIATGSAPRRLDGGNEHARFLRTADDAVALRKRLVPGAHVAIVGAGFIGLEVAATATELGCRVTVIEVAPVPLARDLGDEVGQWFADFHRRRGVALLTGRPALDIEPLGSRYRVVLGGGDAVEADVVAVAAGAEPVVDWLRGSGLSVGDGVICDASLRTSADGVVAAGDVARWYHPLFDESMRVEHWRNAVDHGRHAALSLLGSRDPYVAVPYFWSDQFGAAMRFVGRARAADEVRAVRRDDESLVVVYGRQGVQIGALCVNAARELPAHRAAIASRAPLAAYTG